MISINIRSWNAHESDGAQLILRWNLPTVSGDVRNKRDTNGVISSATEAWSLNFMVGSRRTSSDGRCWLHVWRKRTHATAPDVVRPGSDAWRADAGTDVKVYQQRSLTARRQSWWSMEWPGCRRRIDQDVFSTHLRTGFSWWEAWDQAYLGVTKWETVKVLGLKIQE